MKNLKAGFVGLIGEPNAGKSTIFNELIREKVSIVTSKPQTTRQRVLGIVSSPQSQVVFVDSPGFVSAPKGLNNYLKDEAQKVVEDCDSLILVVSLDEKKKETVEKLIGFMVEQKKPWALIINKMDLVEKRNRVSVIKNLIEQVSSSSGQVIPIFEFSKNWGKDCQLVAKEIIGWATKTLPETLNELYDKELFTTHSVRELTGEIIREKCFENLEQEIPYSLAVHVRSFDEEDAKCTRIHADILVSKDSHRSIVIGSKGQKIKAIGTKSRLDIEKLVQNKVFLKLEVRTEENWMTNPKLMKELGYVVTKRP